MNAYDGHDPMILSQGMRALGDYAGDALLAAWDGCHKIYLAMDEEAAEYFRGDYDHVVEEDLAEIVKNWYDDSCMLRFVEAIWGSPEGCCRFESVIGQGADCDE